MILIEISCDLDLAYCTWRINLHFMCTLSAFLICIRLSGNLCHFRTQSASNHETIWRRL